VASIHPPRLYLIHGLDEDTKRTVHQEPDSSVDRSSAPVRVLHVDDDPDFTEVVASTLESRSDRIEVVTATGASEGLDRLADANIDCIVSDYDMPGMNGIEFLRSARAECPEIPFVLFTGKGSEEIASEAVSAGVTDYLQKTGGIEQYKLLAKKVLDAVETARRRRAHRQQFQAIETAQEGISILDEDRRFSYVNQAYADLYGYEPEEMIGEGWEFIYPDEEVPVVKNNILPAVEQEGYWHGETIGLRADGERFVEDHTLSTTDGGALVCTVRDITDRKERQQDLVRKTRILDEAPIGITLADPRREDTPIVYVNDHFEELTGYDESEVIEENCRFLQGERTDPGRVAQMREAIESREQTQVDIRNYRADGTEFWNRVTIAPIEDDSGQVINWVGFQQDVTGHHERVEALRRYQQIVDTMDEAACLYDEDGRFVVVNQNLADFYGKDPESLAGERSTLIERIREAADGDPYADLVAGEREERHGEVEGSFPNQGYAVVSYRLSRLTTDGEFAGVVGVARDVTERKERERALERENERLEEFASIVSHDLRNPLHVAENYRELVAEECDSDYLEDISRAHGRMEALIEDLLTLARSGETISALQTVDIDEIVENCWQNVETGNADLRVETERTMYANPTRLRQLFENLVRNAVEHASTGGADVTVTVGGLDGGFFVADDGPGIPAEDRETVFESGYSTSDEGTGFGLSIVAEIVEAHGWDVAVTESDDGGARFEITGVEFA
jgi:PAS domain S-box-containing protein